MPRRRRPRLAALAACAALGLSAIAAAGAAGDPIAAVAPERLSCVAPTDAAGIDRVLAGVGSPLAGRGADFVREATAVGLDPRALVAIAAHETLLLTYGPSQAINNPFGLGPGWRFESPAAAIRRAARVLGAYYLAEGRDTIPVIGVKWAPIGVANDPDNLNQHWAGGVSAYYRALGGDPSRPLRLMDQDPSPNCEAIPAASSAPPIGDPVVALWDGTPPATEGPGMRHGGDPVTGRPATIPGFAFPLAPPQGSPVTYTDDFGEPGPTRCYGESIRCAITLTAAPGTAVVAAAAGTLHAATEEEAAAGIAFWLATADGDRIGYGGLASYAEGIGEGAAVTPGQVIGATTGTLPFTWERRGVRINPHALLTATRPSG